MKLKTLVIAAGAALTMSFAGVAFQDAPAHAQSRPYFKLFDLETHPDRMNSVGLAQYSLTP